MSEAVNTNENAYALEMRSVSKRFPGTLAVDQVDFAVRAGEVHALVGENGAGKSTLMKMLAGLYSDYTGEIYIDGKLCELHSPSLAKEHGVGMIFQELSLARRISIYENLLVGRLPKKNALFIDKKEAVRQASELLERVGLGKQDPTKEVSEISQCDAQLTEIAKVLGSNPSIIVMDEPTSALSSEEVKRLFAIIDSLKKQGLAIIYISHHLQEIFEVADNITVMRDGKKVGTYPVEETSTEHLIEKMVGKSVNEFYAEHTAEIGEELLTVKDFTRWGFFHHVDFTVHRGEVLAIVGLAGSGRTEIGRSLVGADPLDQGTVVLDGKEVSFKDMTQAVNGGIGYLTEDRKVAGLAITQSVTDNILVTIIDQLSKGASYYPKKHLGVVNKKIEELSIYPPEPARLVNNLSGGNQQKVLMAKWLATAVDVLVLDEPTRGVDIGAKQIIHQAVLDYAARGNGVILLSSDLPEVVGLCDRAIILREGYIVGEIQKHEINENTLLMAANGEGRHVS
ncbi:sugar ABC transporter ATP-binding protein [Christensenellaceae bacterium OttesenSCG-928-K19]|nr:sugar ABC transporter ATP-binding protein [Christensenellaceae bacterium OttesenSCG-928-K19]